jgi:hypothetical protein
MAAVVLMLAAAPQLEAQSRDPYGPTIQFGTGLINTPVAWVSPRSGDLWITTSGKTLPQDGANFATTWNTNISAETHWMGRFTIGASAYSQNPEWGFFGRALLIRDGQFGFLPGIAIGARNIGPYEKSDRLLIAHDVCLIDTTGGGGGTYVECVDTARFGGFKTTPTLFAVATKDVSIGSMMGSMPGGSLSFSIGMGNGLFSEDGDLGESYNKSGTIAKGLFLGTRLTMHPTLNTTLSFVAENDGWDYNLGVSGDWRGITLGLYATELEEGGGNSSDEGSPYNYRKFNVLLSYSGNVVDISRGILLRARITELTREQDRLRIEIAQRQRRIAGLEVALRRAQAGELADIARRREELDREVQAEREAIRRAEERLRQIQQGQQTPPPPSTPPSITPPTP